MNETPTFPALDQYVGYVCTSCSRCRVCGQPVQPTTTQPSWVVAYPTTTSGTGTFTVGGATQTVPIAGLAE
jgi:hypothetical protein